MDTIDHIFKENDLDVQILNLTPCEITILDERKIAVSYELYMILIMCGQLCSICGVGPKQFMNSIDEKFFPPKPGHLQSYILME